jgi:hypothetical protein
MVTKRLNIVKRVYALERKAQRNKAEVKYLDTNLDNVLTPVTSGGFVYFYLTDIAQGALKGQRIGDEVRILKVEIRGQASNPGLDLFLCKNKTGAAIATSMFALGSSGTFLEPNDFTTYHHELTGLKSSNNCFSFVKSWGTGLKNSYHLPDATSLQTNRLMFVMKCSSNSGTGGSVNASCRLWYTDA